MTTTAVATATGGAIEPTKKERSPEQIAAANIKAWLGAEKFQHELRTALPSFLPPERMIRVGLTTIMRSPDLMKCTPASLCRALIAAGQLGLEVDGALGHAYLVPFWNSQARAHEAQFIPGYRGLIALARRSGDVQSISAHVVYDRDHFEFRYGIDEKLEHIPTLGAERGEFRCVYSIARFKDGGYAFDVLSRAEVERIRDNSPGGKKAMKDGYGPWVDHFDEMARKTAVRRLAKYLPLSVEFQRAAAIDEDRPEAMADILDAGPVVVEVEDDRPPTTPTIEDLAADLKAGKKDGGSKAPTDDEPRINPGQYTALVKACRDAGVTDEQLNGYVAAVCPETTPERLPVAHYADVLEWIAAEKAKRS